LIASSASTEQWIFTGGRFSSCTISVFLIFWASSIVLPFNHSVASDCGAAAESFELRVHDRIVLHLDLELHDVAALRGSDHAGTDPFLVLLETSHVAGIIEMIDDFVTIGHGSLQNL